MILRNSYTFSAAHRLPAHQGLCQNLHGHNYTFEVGLDGPIDPETGMVMDFGDMDDVVNEHAVKPLDHRMLNELMPNPTAEHIAQWIWRALQAHLPLLAEVRVYEIPQAVVIYRGEYES